MVSITFTSMPVDISQTADRRLERQLLRSLEANRSAFPSPVNRARMAFYRRGYLSSMYRASWDGHDYLFAVKHYDKCGERAQREYGVMLARAGRRCPRPIFVDTSAEFTNDAILVTEFVPDRQHWCYDLESLAELMADIHSDNQLMRLPVDADGPAVYSLEHEFEEESQVIPTFRSGTIRDLLEELRELLRLPVQRWAVLFPPEQLVYVHGDLPHSHVFQTTAGPVVIHWEYSHRSHPAREFGRTSCLIHLSDQDVIDLLALYHKFVPYRVTPLQVRVQEALEYFYACIHGLFWMDRGDTQFRRTASEQPREERASQGSHST